MKSVHLELVRETFTIAQRCEVSDWIQLKKMILLSLPPEARKSFSTRHPVTKKHSINDFERQVIDTYYSETGVRLRLPDEE